MTPEAQQVGLVRAHLAAGGGTEVPIPQQWSIVVEPDGLQLPVLPFASCTMEGSGDSDGRDLPKRNFKRRSRMKNHRLHQTSDEASSKRIGMLQPGDYSATASGIHMYSEANCNEGVDIDICEMRHRSRTTTISLTRFRYT